MARLMPGFYLTVYERLPDFLKKRINPLEYGIRAFVKTAASSRPEGVGSRPVVLDAGAGQSRFSQYFSPSWLYLAVDSKVGDGSWDYSRIDLEADLLRLPVLSGRVAVVINTQVLEHVSDPAVVLREMYRVLQPGGELYLTAPQGWHEHQQPHDFFRFTRFSLEMLLHEAGFQRMEIRPMGGYFHYLGHRLTYLPKVLFEDRRGLVRFCLFPLELMSLIVFCFAGPITCYYLDYFDRKKEFTLGYCCVAVK